MNIGIFTDTYYPTINGVSTSTRMLQKELSKLGHKVYIFTVSDPQAQKGVPRVFRLPSMPFIFLPTHRMCLLYSPKLLLKLKKLNLDIVHTQTEFPLGIFGKIVAEYYRLPSVHTYHTMYEDYVHYIANGHLLTPKHAQAFSRIFCNRADIVIAPVEKTRNKLIDYGVKKPIRILPTGIDFTPFSRSKYTNEDIAALKNELGIALDAPVIITVGRVAKEKSMDVIIKQMPNILKRLPETKLVIVGNGPLIAELTELTQKLDIKSSVIFTGPVLWDIIGKYYRLGDVFVTASTSETQGLTHIEAMASHIPVVAKRDSSYENIVCHGETGYFFECDEDAADIMCHVLENREEAERIACNAFDGIKHLSAEHFAKKVEVLYKEVLAMHEPKRGGYLSPITEKMKLGKLILKKLPNKKEKI